MVIAIFILWYKSRLTGKVENRVWMNKAHWLWCSYWFWNWLIVQHFGVFLTSDKNREKSTKFFPIDFCRFSCYNERAIFESEAKECESKDGSLFAIPRSNKMFAIDLFCTKRKNRFSPPNLWSSIIFLPAYNLNEKGIMVDLCWCRTRLQALLERAHFIATKIITQKTWNMNFYWMF